MRSSNSWNCHKKTAITFRRKWDFLIQSAHVVDLYRLTPICFVLDTAYRDNFHPVFEYACREEARCLILEPPFITHGVADMVREVRFTTHNSSYLMSGAIALLFVAPTFIAAENMQAKARFGGNELQGNA